MCIFHRYYIGDVIFFVPNRPVSADFFFHVTVLAVSASNHGEDTHLNDSERNEIYYIYSIFVGRLEWQWARYIHPILAIRIDSGGWILVPLALVAMTVEFNSGDAANLTIHRKISWRILEILFQFELRWCCSMDRGVGLLQYFAWVWNLSVHRQLWSWMCNTS